MAIWAWILLFSLVASVGVVLAMAYFYFKTLHPLLSIPVLLNFAVGTLLASAFLGLLPEALSHHSPVAVLSTALAGILLFYGLERSLIWRHCHNPQCEVHGAAGPIIVIGDAFHNFVDGVVIATAFLTSIPTGIGVSIAVIAHEIPQELGDFAILTTSGYTKQRAIFLNTLSAAAAIVGSVLSYLLFSHLRQAIPYLLAVSAASFIYIGTADLIPRLKTEARPPNRFAQLASLLLGIGVIGALRAGLI